MKESLSTTQGNLKNLRLENINLAQDSDLFENALF